MNVKPRDFSHTCCPVLIFSVLKTKAKYMLRIALSEERTSFNTPFAPSLPVPPPLRLLMRNYLEYA